MASALVRASMAPSQRCRERCCPQGATLGLTLGFANDLVAGRPNRGLPGSPATRVGQFTRAASARREVMSSFM